MTITVSRTISMGHRLKDYDGVCSSPHGHNVKFEVEIDSALQFLDFKQIDKDLWKTIEPMDHAMVLELSDPLFTTLTDMGFRTFSMNSAPTTEALASYVYAYMQHKGYQITRCTVFETEKYSATVRS